MKTMKSLFCAALELTYGVEVVPDPETDAIVLVENPTIKLLSEEVENAAVLPHFGKRPPLIINKGYEIGIKFEHKSSGTAGQSPIHGRIIRAAGYNENITPATSVVYTEHSDYDGDSLTVYFYLDGLLHKLKGTRVKSLKLPMANNQKNVAEATLQGLYSGPVSEVNWPASIAFNEIDPAVWNNANFKVNSVAQIVSKFDVTIENEMVARDSSNAANGILEYIIVDRTVTANWDPEIPAFATFNPEALHLAQTLINLETKPTADPGKMFEVLLNNMTLNAPEYAERNKMRIYNLTGVARTSLTTGNNNSSFVYK